VETIGFAIFGLLKPLMPPLACSCVVLPEHRATSGPAFPSAGAPTATATQSTPVQPEASVTVTQ